MRKEVKRDLETEVYFLIRKKYLYFYPEGHSGSDCGRAAISLTAAEMAYIIIDRAGTGNSELLFARLRIEAGRVLDRSC